MRMGQGVRTGLGHGGITCVLQTQLSRFFFSECMKHIALTFLHSAVFIVISIYIHQWLKFDHR